jgi:1-acyl-sn-glycerol-3-phosphate acyltransferase
VGLSFAGANKSETRVPIVPIGLVNGGVIYPKQAKDAMITGGAAVGRTYHFRFGDPVWYDTLVPGKPKPRETEVRSAIVENLDRQFGELTGREIGPPARSKAKKKD